MKYREDIASTKLESFDIGILIVYLLLVLAVGLISSWRSKPDSLEGYFLANRSANWILVGASLYASNLGTDRFLGLAGAGAKTGIAIAGFELNAVVIILVLGWVFVPVYIAAGVYTMPEYLRKRFGGQRIRIYLSVLALLLYVFTKISADLYAGALFIQQSLGWNLYISVFALLATTVVSIIGGGLHSVIWIDFTQCVIMLIGATGLAVKSISAVGGFDELFRKFPKASPPLNETGFNAYAQSCNAVPDNFAHLLRSADDPELPWPGMVFGITFNALWYWCSDQVIVQRSLAAKNLSHAKGGSILTGYLKILSLFLLVLPGMAARILYPEYVACSRAEICTEICGNPWGCSNMAYTLLVLRLMPVGEKGLMMSAMTASLIGNFASIFNSSSTLFTVDIWNTIRRKKASETELLIVGKCFVAFLVVVSIMWLPIIENTPGTQLFYYIQSLTSYLAPTVSAVFVLAIIWEGTTEQGAFWSLMVGLVVGMIRFGWDYAYPEPICESGEISTKPAILSTVHYLHFGILLYCLTTAICIAISLMTRRIPKKHLYRLTLWTLKSLEPREDLDRLDSEFDTSSKSVLNGHSNYGAETDDGNWLKIRSHSNTPRPPSSKRRSTLLWCFGVGLDNAPVSKKITTPEEEALEANKNIQENPFAKKFCDLNAGIALMAVGFVYGYYA